MKQIFVIDQDDFPPGLNSSGGLMRSHWSQRDKILKKFQWLIYQAKLQKFLGPVKVLLLGYVHRYYDWDNFASLFKIPGDALVKQNILLDDAPKIIQDFKMRQIQVKMKERKRLEIHIEDFR